MIRALKTTLETGRSGAASATQVPSAEQVPSATDLRGTATPRLVAVATAVPSDSYTQADLLHEFRIADHRVQSVFRNGAIDRRYLSLPPVDGTGLRRVETQGELLHKHLTNGLALGAQAIRSCLDRAGLRPADVRHLCCVTSTGLLTPGFSALLIKNLGIPASCSRLDVVGMGCNAGLNALAASASWAACHAGSPALLVCVEVCSAAYVFDGTMRSAVVNSLFGDGAAALLVVGGADGDPAGAPAANEAAPARGPALLRFSSHLIPEAVHAMRYDWDDDQGKFSFYLDPEVPYVVGANVEAAVGRLLAGTGLRRSDIAHWIVHSGGKKVIDSIRLNLGLSRHDLRHTISVLRDYGNVSSGSFLFSYERLLVEGGVAPGDYGVLMTMGPGSTIELALARWEGV